MARGAGVESVEQLQCHSGSGSGAGVWRNADGMAPISEFQPAPYEGPVLIQVFFGEDAAVRLDVGGYRVGHVAGVEGGGAMLPYTLQHVGEVGLAVVGERGEVAGGELVARHEHAPEFFVGEELVGRESERVDVVPARSMPVPGERDGGG